MRLKDVVELIRVDMPDHTTGAFDVILQSDDGGTHITICVENHDDASTVMQAFITRFKENRIIVMKVPEGTLHSDEFSRHY
tara:strand:- start:176 stop:418 length:243 start_codon:yes stop_codon:yes gene_type:complete